jgi:hypothetical protein
MPVGACQANFAAAALEDGVRLKSRRFPWLTRRGHLDLPAEAEGTVAALRRIFIDLGGSEQRLADAHSVPLTSDFYFEPSRTLVEVDEFQHFTTARFQTLTMYPKDAVLGFEIEHYTALCAKTSIRADKYFPNKAGGAFGPGGRQRQRAYNDALRDLAAPAMGHPGVIRASALDQSGFNAWIAVRSRFP